MIVGDYQLLQEIGHGSYAVVYKARHRTTKEIFAIKKMKDMPRNDQIAVQNQIELLRRIKHKSIIRFEKDFKEKGKWYLVFQYCGKGDLQSFKNKQQKIPQYFTKMIFFSILEAVCILHQNKIVHRDLKLANILINDDYDIKLADFGFSKDNEAGLMYSYCGTPLTMAPQILERKPYDQRCDTWSLGILLYQFIYNKTPFYPSKQYGSGLDGFTKAVLKAKPVLDPNVQISQQCKDVIIKCLQKNMNNRPTAKQLKSHQWFQTGIASVIRKDYIKKSMSDTSQNTIQKIKSVTCKAAQQKLKLLIQYLSLTDSEIKQNLRLLCKYYPLNQTIQTIYLLKITQLLNQLSKINIVIKIDGYGFSIEIKNIKKFQTHRDNLRQYLNTQLKKRKLFTNNNINIQKQITKFIVNNSQSCLGLDQRQQQKIPLIKSLASICLKQIEELQIQISWYLDPQFDLLRKQINNTLEKVKLEDIMNYVNDQQINQEDIKSIWLITQNIKQKQVTGLQYYIGNIMQEVIKINNNIEILQN